jgi:hypothetical protein
MDMTTDHEQQLGQLRLDVRELETDMRNELKLIRENHLAHIQDAMQKFQLDFVQVRNDVAWLLKFFWIIAGISVTNVLVNLFER